MNVLMFVAITSRVANYCGYMAVICQALTFESKYKILCTLSQADFL